MAAVLLLCGARALPAPQEVSNLMAPPQFQPPLKTLQEGLGEPAGVREALEPRAGEVPTGQPLAGEVPTGQPVAGEPAAVAEQDGGAVRGHPTVYRWLPPLLLPRLHPDF